MLVDNILAAIGRTPLVRLSRVGAGLSCNLYAKCEFLNPGGSVKDRIGYRMVQDAEKIGRIKPGDTLIEPTSGNTGIGIALAGAVKGYRVIITMPEKMSREKQVVLEALGAEIIRTPTEAAWDAPESHISVAARLQRELPNAHILDQYSNPSNPTVHYETTAQEILDDLDGKVDMIVIGAGTGGTITGVAKRLKEANPKCIVVGADPVGSILAGEGPIQSYKVEGIGYDFIPKVLDRNLVDRWVKTTDRPAFVLARRLIREEGLLCGGSSGTAMFAALQEARSLQAGQNCVVLLPDGVRNYMTKFVDDKWMRDNRFFGLDDNLKGSVADVLHLKNKQELFCMLETDSVRDAVESMRQKSFSQIPVTDHAGVLVGLLNERDLLDYINERPGLNLQVPIIEVMGRNTPTVKSSTPLPALHELLLNASSVVVVDDNRLPQQIVTKIDLIEWIAESQNKV